GSSCYYFSGSDDRVRIVAALRTLNRRLEAENTRWLPNPRKYEAIRDSSQSRYAQAVAGAARDRQREIKTPWSYYCPFCSRVVDAGAICLQPCRHLVLFGVPGHLWLGPHEAEISRLASLVSDAFYDGASLSDLLREPFE